MLKYNLDIDKNSKWIIGAQPEVIKTFPFYCTEAGEFFAGKKYYTERDSRSGYQLIYTVSGCGRFIFGTETISLPAGSAIIIRCSERHRYETDTAVWHNLWLHFDGAGAAAYERYINEAGRYYAVEISDTDGFTSNLRLVLNLAEKTDMISYSLSSDCISSLMTEALTQRLRSGISGSDKGGRYPEIHAAISFIRQNYNKQIGIDDITSVANMSRFHFIRVFKRHMGVTPYDYLIGCRISKAKILLRTTSKSVFEIAEEVGYKSKSNFIAKFRDLTGMTPAIYRRENIAKIK